EAAARWLRRGKRGRRLVTMRKAEYERQLKKRQKQLERDLLPVAHHEAGHAVAAALLDINFLEVDVQAQIRLCNRGDDSGLELWLGCLRIEVTQGMRRLHLARHRKLAENHAIMSMAGPLAEGLYRGRRTYLRRSKSSDMEF